MLRNSVFSQFSWTFYIPLAVLEQKQIRAPLFLSHKRFNLFPSFSRESVLCEAWCLLVLYSMYLREAGKSKSKQILAPSNGRWPYSRCYGMIVSELKCQVWRTKEQMYFKQFGSKMWYTTKVLRTKRWVSCQSSLVPDVQCADGSTAPWTAGPRQGVAIRWWELHDLNHWFTVY